MGCLGNSDLATITEEEYAIMKTPEGELYNKAIIEKYVWINDVNGQSLIMATIMHVV